MLSAITCHLALAAPVLHIKSFNLLQCARTEFIAIFVSLTRPLAESLGGTWAEHQENALKLDYGDVVCEYTNHHWLYTLSK